MNKSLVLAGAGLAAMAGAAAYAQTRPAAGGGTAVYWMTAETSSGMAGMAAGMNGGNPASMMGALMGRGRGGQSSYVHNLTLQLGTGRRPAGEPMAEHLPPPGLQAGASLPLVSPQAAVAPRGPTTPYQMPTERPRGRMLIYWGCGEHARPGQPVVIDFATMAAGRMPPIFASSPFHPMTPPSAATNATYGEWPNQRSQVRVPASGSLVGPHTVRGNYTPEINFTLAPGQDFLAPVRLTSNVAAGTGSVPLIWQPVPGSKAWLATTMGGGGSGGDFVLWTSSETQVAMMGMGMDYLADADIARLVQQRVLMPGTTDRCTVPVEVARAAPQSMMTLTAFGGDANFSNPPRPARAAASWRPDWTVKFRSKSTYMGLLGMNMPGAGDDSANPPEQQNNGRRGGIRRKLGKILGN